MKSVGTVRKTDDLGRLCLPAEIGRIFIIAPIVHIQVELALDAMPDFTIKQLLTPIPSQL